MVDHANLAGTLVAITEFSARWPEKSDMENRDEWIRRRAYALWEQEGRPSGRDAAHWEQANEERNALEKGAASIDGGEVTDRIKDRLALFALKRQKPSLTRQRLRKSA